MEKQNLGTKSTRPAIIQILLDRNYTSRKGKVFYVTELGYLLIDALLDVWESFLKPNFTAKVESLLQDIKENKTTLKVVVDSIRREFLSLFDEFRNQKQKIISKMDKLKQNGNTINVKQKNQMIDKPINKKKTFPLSTANCPVCKKSKMKLIHSKKKSSNFLVCEDENCKTFLSLPKKGTIKLLKSQCQQCGFNVVKISMTKNKKKFDYYICPICWNHGLKNHIEGFGFCSKCNKFQINRGRCIKK
jgi:hypothetical protein